MPYYRPDKLEFWRLDKMKEFSNCSFHQAHAFKEHYMKNQTKIAYEEDFM